jgi:ABC-type dipeptide/oligopeptide/nickel transport system permease component
MSRFVLRRLVIILAALVAVNFLGFAYALIAQRVHQAQNPFGSGVEGWPPIWPLYMEYVGGILRGDFGNMPIGLAESMVGALIKASGASLGLLGLAFTFSLVLGLLLGVLAVRANPARVSGWLVPLSTAGLALPSFYIGTVFIVAMIYYLLGQGKGAPPPLPLQGFGWDLHLVLPTLALMVRPTMQIAQVTAGLLSGELDKQYVTAARSRGNSWGRALWRHALRNVLAPVVLTVAGSFRLLVGELVLVEWLFGWPGLGRLLAFSLIAPRLAGPSAVFTGIYFLHPPLVAALLTVFTFIFLLADTLASLIARAYDPRLRAPETEGRHG